MPEVKVVQSLNLEFGKFGMYKKPEKVDLDEDDIFGDLFIKQKRSRIYTDKD